MLTSPFLLPLLCSSSFSVPNLLLLLFPIRPIQEAREKRRDGWYGGVGKREKNPPPPPPPSNTAAAVVSREGEHFQMNILMSPPRPSPLLPYPILQPADTHRHPSFSFLPLKDPKTFLTAVLRPAKTKKRRRRPVGGRKMIQQMAPDGGKEEEW